MTTKTIYTQFKENVLAIMALIVASTALGYNTWRNEKTEANRTTRVAAFEVLKDLGELQVIVNYSFYKVDNPKQDPMLGWGYIALIGDLSETLPSPVHEQVNKLVEVWKNNWSSLTSNEESADKITEQINNTRAAVRDQLRQLK